MRCSSRRSGKRRRRARFPYAFADCYNGPGRWLQGLGFVETGGFIGKEGSLPGYESITMYSPTLDTTIEVVSTKQPNAITPTRMLQALAMDLFGSDVDVGLTYEEALAPSYTGRPPEN